MANSSLTYRPVPTSASKELAPYTTNTIPPVLVVDVSGIGGKSVLQGTAGNYVRKTEVIATTEHRAISLTKTIIEIVTIADVFQNTSSGNNNISDVADASDTKSITISKAPSESITNADVLVIDTSKVATESITNSENVSLVYTKNILEILTCSDLPDIASQTQELILREDGFLIVREDDFSFVRESNDLDDLVDSSTTVDNLVLLPTKGLLDTSTTTDGIVSFIINTSRTLDTSTTTDTVVFTPTRVIPENIVVTELVTRIITKIITESVTSTDDISINNAVLREDGFLMLREDDSNMLREGVQ